MSILRSALGFVVLQDPHTERIAGGEMAEERGKEVARDEEQEQREEAREQLAREIDDALEAQRELYEAAAGWMALVEFVMQSDGPCVLVIEEEDDDVVATRKVMATFPQHVGEDDVRNQFANMRDDLMLANAQRAAITRRDPKYIVGHKARES